jgi:hypothetical protein
MLCVSVQDVFLLYKQQLERKVFDETNKNQFAGTSDGTRDVEVAGSTT